MTKADLESAPEFKKTARPLARRQRHALGARQPLIAARSRSKTKEARSGLLFCRLGLFAISAGLLAPMAQGPWGRWGPRGRGRGRRGRPCRSGCGGLVSGHVSGSIRPYEERADHHQREDQKADHPSHVSRTRGAGKGVAQTVARGGRGQIGVIGHRTCSIHAGCTPIQTRGTDLGCVARQAQAPNNLGALDARPPK